MSKNLKITIQNPNKSRKSIKHFGNFENTKCTCFEKQNGFEEEKKHENMKNFFFLFFFFFQFLNRSNISRYVADFFINIEDIGQPQSYRSH